MENECYMCKKVMDISLMYPNSFGFVCQLCIGEYRRINGV